VIAWVKRKKRLAGSGARKGGRATKMMALLRTIAVTILHRRAVP
jgi:hypothetical protein